mmetsp:Transcript_9199/g.24250  ORF Transcript_9199/g.24250 Transcript_9199/m.24250 type:complete len:126 (+) Transcript_9199:63-440(+)
MRRARIIFLFFSLCFFWGKRRKRLDGVGCARCKLGKAEEEDARERALSLCGMVCLSLLRCGDVRSSECLVMWIGEGMRGAASKNRARTCSREYYAELLMACERCKTRSAPERKACVVVQPKSLRL